MVIFFIAKKNGFLLFSKIISRAPILKPYYQQVTLAQYTACLIITIGAGLNFYDAIALSAYISKDEDFNRAVQVMLKAAQVGRPLHEAMRTNNFYPHFFCDLVKIGEETGKLETLLNQAAFLLESDLQQSLHYLKQSAEPLIMVILGVVIGIVIISLYLPIFNLGNIF